MEKYGVIGYPLDHSISPEIHNMAFSELNLDASYTKIEIPPNSFEQKILQLKTEKWSGFNVTIPFKEKIIDFLDEIDPISRKIGAINTVKVIEKKWIGYNTDYIGFIRPLKSEIQHLKSALVIGAGGAAKAIVYSLIEKTSISEIYIANRTIARAESLTAEIVCPDNIKLSIISLKQIENICQPIDLVVNTTNVGMGKLIDETPIENLEKLPNSVIYDLIYNPKNTKLLRLAEMRGHQIINGLPMLIFQAEESFKIWTGKSFPEVVINHFL